MQGSLTRGGGRLLERDIFYKLKSVGGYQTRGVHYRTRGRLLQCRSLACWKKSCEAELNVS